MERGIPEQCVASFSPGLREAFARNTLVHCVEVYGCVCVSQLARLLSWAWPWALLARTLLLHGEYVTIYFCRWTVHCCAILLGSCRSCIFTCRY